MTIKYKNGFGAGPTLLDVATDPGLDAVVVLQNANFAISQIIATYSISGKGVPPAVRDYDTGGADALRSFTGRLLVLEGVVDINLSSGAVPNALLVGPVPDQLKSRTLFDIMLNDWRRPFDFIFPATGPGSLRSSTETALSVILIAGECFTAAGAREYVTLQQLHVNASILGTDNITWGPLHAKN